AALEWAHTTNPEKGMRIARALWVYWYARGDWSEGSMRCEVAAASSDASPHWRVRALAAGAGLATNGLELGRARTLGGQAVALARSIHDDRALLEAVYAEASAYFFTDPQRGRTLAHEASELASKSGDRFWIARTLYGLGICDCHAGNYRSGRRLLEEAVDLFTDSNSRLALHLAFFWLGQASLAQGDLEGARRWTGEGLAAAREFRNVQIEAANYCTIAHANALTGDQELAITALENARAMSAKHPDPITASILPYYDDVLSYAFGEPTATTQSWRDALEFFEAGGFWWFASSILSIRADIVRVNGDLTEAESLAERAFHAAEESGNPHSIGRGARARANVLRAKGDTDTAEDLYHLALRSFDEAGAKADVVFTLESLAGIAVHGESWQEAARLFGAANHLRETLGYERFAADIPDYERDLGRVKENLDVQALELGWSEGAALTLDEAVAYAARGRGERKRPTSGWKSLTPMENEVVRLVTTGLSNAEIGKRLFISPGTVKNHLSHVFGKLDISTRAELAAEAARRKL
ncbi:MAG: helix-turn-helix transcriptional regulator, partial [Actinomycetota bacterium]|nr:helix-turn-helix transcriptional regulator [Actinomycetota bacterium]